MKLFLIVLYCTCIALSPIAARAADGPSPWAGTYVYDYKGPKTSGGERPVVTYTLTLDPDSAKMPCALTVEGFQAEDTILCGVSVDKKEIGILFKSFGDGRIVNKYDVAVYKPSDLLFTMSKPKGQLITRWNKLTPADKVVKGRFFKKKTK